MQGIRLAGEGAKHLIAQVDAIYRTILLQQGLRLLKDLLILRIHTMALWRSPTRVLESLQISVLCIKLWIEAEKRAEKGKKEAKKRGRKTRPLCEF
jgi:hypothetical protein